mgnify:CR=1 FL=1
MDCLADGQGISTVASDQRGQEKKETTDYGIKKEKKKRVLGKGKFSRRVCTVATHRN